MALDSRSVLWVRLIFRMKIRARATRKFMLAGRGIFSISVAVIVFVSAASANIQGQQGCGDTTVLISGRTAPETFAVQGSVAGTTGLAGTTIYWTITQTTSGILTFSSSQQGPYTPSITIPMALDGSGSGQVTYYVKGASGGHTVIVESSPQCGGGAPQCGGVIPPADYTVKGCACPAIPPIQ